MKKFFALLASFFLILSIGFAAAQVNIGGVSVGVGGTVGGTPVGVGVSVGGVAGGVAGTRGITQGTYQRTQNTADLTFVQTLLAQIGGIVAMLPKILTGVAVVAFFWFLIRYFLVDAADPAKKSDAMKGMGYSLLAIFVMVALWGILAFFGDAIGINSNTSVQAIQLPQ